MPSLGTGLRTGLIVFDIALSTYETYEYFEGRRTHREYWTGMALNGAMLVLPHPISTAIAAHQLGTFLGGYLANRLLEDYRRGDPVARALINWMRRNGWINANDPTFVAVSERHPARLTARHWRIAQGDAVPVPLALWSPAATDAVLRVRNATSEDAIEPLDIRLTVGVTRALIDGAAVAEWPAGDYVVTLEPGGGTGYPVFSLTVASPDESDAETPALAPDIFSVTAELRETRLEPTDLPWSRFDRPDILIQGELPATAESFGSWVWSEDPGAPGGHVHERGDGPATIHYVLLPDERPVITGENIIQYFWIDPGAPAGQIVLQVYDERLDARHRVSFGGDLLALDGSSGAGLVQAGSLPSAGRWMRLRLPVDDIALGGRSIRGVGFISDTGRVLWGPTRLSGAEDFSPMLVQSDARDTSGAPQADMMIAMDVPAPGNIKLDLVTADGGRIPVAERTVYTGFRQVWWQGEAELLVGARVMAVFTPVEGEAAEREIVLEGNAALAARILYPPEGAVVRQTVPIFGQAGGSDFARYEVEIRPSGGGDDSWRFLASSETASVVTDAEVARRIDTIMAKELRGTIYGNLASLKTGSALHRFEFAEETEIVPSGWVDIRLTTYDKAGNGRSDQTRVRIGEVATGLVRSEILSPDKAAALSLPPFALPAGIGTLSIDLAAEQQIPADAPAPVSRVYEIAPSGLAFASPVSVSITAGEGTAIAAIDRFGAVRHLPTSRDGEILRAAVADPPAGTRFYVSTAPAPESSLDRQPVDAPWFAAADPPAPIAARADFQPGMALLRQPVEITDNLIMTISLTPTDIAGTGLLFRFDGEARLIALGNGSDLAGTGIAAAGLSLAADGKRQAVLLPLNRVLPAGARQLESVELKKIVSAAWRNYVARPVPAEAVEIHALTIGHRPAADADKGWTAPGGWRLKDGDAQGEGPIALTSQGWHRIALAGDAETTWPVLVDTVAPVVSDLAPEDGSTSPELVVSAKLVDAGAGLDPASIRLRINGTDVPSDKLSFDASSGTLSAAIGDIPGVRVDSGSIITAELEASDALGNRSETQTWSWTYRAEALALGNLRQVTVDGGYQPEWLPDGTGFVFVSDRGGRSGLYKLTLDSGAIEPLTTSEARITSPAVGPGGEIAVLADGRLMLGVGSDAREIPLAVPVVDPAFRTAATLVAGQDNRIVEIDLQGGVGVLCEISSGAKALRPRPVGDRIVFTQQIYHRTVWLCDPATGQVTPISENLDRASTRDIDATGMGGDALLYARDDGAGGFWRRTTGNPELTLILPGGVGSDRRPTLSPDGSTLIFDTDRTGRREIWRLDLSEPVSLSVAGAARRGVAGEAIAIRYDGPTDGLSWSVIDAAGEVAAADLQPTDEANALILRPDADLPEGELQVQVQLPTGLVARAAAGRPHAAADPGGAAGGRPVPERCRDSRRAGPIQTGRHRRDPGIAGER